jgi:hypothetical protein
LPSGPWPGNSTTPTSNVGGLRGRATPTVRNASTTTSEAPKPTGAALPHFQLPLTRRANFDMLLWGVVLVVALLTAFGVYYFFPPK